MPPPVRPAMSQTVVTVQRYPSRVSARKAMDVYIDGRKAANYSVANGGSVSIPVNDGVHSIYVQVGKIKSEELNFTAAQKTVSFVATIEGGLMEMARKRVVLSRGRVIDDTGEMTDRDMQRRFINEEAPSLTPAVSKEAGLEDAVGKAVLSMVDDLPGGSKIAVVNIASESGGEVSSFVIDALEYRLVSAGGFTVVDRNTLDVVRMEQKFQMGGEVSDESVVAVGNLAGATVVITGTVIEFGGAHRLSLRALDVTTGQIVAMARVAY